VTGHPCPGTPSRRRPVGSSWKSALLRRGLIAAQKVNGQVKRTIKDGLKINQIPKNHFWYLLVLFSLVGFWF
ncbi:hypothetical protein, partial [Pantoea agglomerans]|uniref:hypothetical protein n=1 Tax=Enterobacter agglomerans TaxID=549 RepID=UPI001F48AF58